MPRFVYPFFTFLARVLFNRCVVVLFINIDVDIRVRRRGLSVSNLAPSSGTMDRSSVQKSTTLPKQLTQAGSKFFLSDFAGSSRFQFSFADGFDGRDHFVQIFDRSVITRLTTRWMIEFVPVEFFHGNEKPVLASPDRTWART